MSDTRRKNTEWEITDQGTLSYAGASLAVLMDIRDELRLLNGLLRCQNFLQIPSTLRGIRRNTAKPRKKTTTRRKR